MTLVDTETGEVVTSASHAELVPLPADTTELDRLADPAAAVILSCERAKGWLQHALETAGIEEIVETKAQAEAIRVYATQKELGRDAELAAQEIVRRAERCIGLAIRKGQDEGRIRTNGSHDQFRGPFPDEKRSSPSDFLPNGSDMADTYKVTDDVTDEDFEAALAEAKEEGNLSRANVVRKVGQQKVAPSAKPRRRRFDPNRSLLSMVSTLEGMAMGWELFEPEDYVRLDVATAPEFIALSEVAIRKIRRHIRLMKEAIGDE